MELSCAAGRSRGDVIGDGFTGSLAALAWRSRGIWRQIRAKWRIEPASQLTRRVTAMRAHPLTPVVPASHIRAAGEWARSDGIHAIRAGYRPVRHQRRLLDYWASLRGHASLPIWRGLDADEFGVPLDNLAWTEVVGARRRHALPDRISRRELVEAFGRSNASANFSTKSCRRHTSARARDLPAGRERQGADLYRLRHARPGGPDRPPRAPAAAVQPGRRRDRAHPCLDRSVSPEGPFELRELMKSPIRPPVIALCATIQY